MGVRVIGNRFQPLALRWLSIGALGMALVGPANAQRLAAENSAAVSGFKNAPLSPRQTLKIRQISDLQISPNGDRIAMSVAEPVKGTRRTSNIWVFDRKSRRMIHFTTSSKSDRRPRWSADGNRLAFLSNRDGKTQIYLISWRGGEAEALTESKTDIRSFEWSPNGHTIAFLSADPKTEEEEKNLKNKNDAIVVDQDTKDPRLRLIDADSGKVRTLTPDKLRIAELLWAPRGDRLILSATDHPRRDLLSNHLYSVDLSDNPEIKAIETPQGPFRGIKISGDGGTIAYLGGRTKDGPQPHDLFMRAIEGGKSRNLTSASVDRPISSFHWRRDGSLTVLAAAGFTTAFYNVNGKGKATRLAGFEVLPSRSFAAGPGVLAFVGETATRQPELWISDGSGKSQQVSHFNKDWDAIKLIKPRILQYPSFDGVKIEAALFLPAEYRQGTPLPSVVLVHGGPSSRWSQRFHAWAQLLATRGVAVLCPNIRGSTGYGHPFLISNRYDWGGDDWKDVLAGVDFVVGRGIADPERLGIGGWSYGGYMAAWAVTQTTRFKAAVSGAPMTDLASEFGTESPGVNIGDTWALGTPYENLDLFIQHSPVTFVKNVKTPILLLQGEKDQTDPLGQSRQFYRGLRRYGVEAQLVVYPRMGHGPREEEHRLDILNRMIDWFSKYLKLTESAGPVDG